MPWKSDSSHSLTCWSFETRFLQHLVMLEMVVFGAAGGLTLVAWLLFGLPLSRYVDFGVTLSAGLFVLCVGAIAAGVGWFTIRLSHAMCEPIARAIEALRLAQEGLHPAPIPVRADDDFRELEETVNASLDMFYNRQAESAFALTNGEATGRFAVRRPGGMN